MSRQSGTLIELNLLGVVLAVAGMMLFSTHPAFILLTAAGVALPFLPAIFALADGLVAAKAASARWQSLLASGFVPAIEVRARRIEGGAYVGVDSNAQRMAFVTATETRQVEFAQVRAVKFDRTTLTEWGKGSKTRYGFLVVTDDAEHPFGLSYPGKRAAMKALGKLKGILGAGVPFDNSGAA